MYKVTFTACNNYLKVIVSGERTVFQREDGAKSWIKISSYCNKNKTKKMLLISKLTGKIDKLSSYDISSALDYFGLSKEVKIAFIETDAKSRKVNSFTSNFAKKKGFDIEVFNKNDEGISWLMK